MLRGPTGFSTDISFFDKSLCTPTTFSQAVAPNTTMASVNLPEELLQQIMWGLKLDVYSNTPADDKLATRKTLLSCMLANSTLHRLAEPVLYHSISQHELTKLVQCFIRRPKLVSLVRALRDCENDTHGRLTGGLCDIDAWREENIDICELWGRPYEIPAIGFVLLMCTRLEILVLEKNACDQTFPSGDFLEECTALHQRAHIGLSTPLAALRTLIMQPGPMYCFSMFETDDRWLPGLVSLPNIERIEVAELGMYDFEIPSSAGISTLRSLTIGYPTTAGFGYSGQMALSMVLERLLVNCPALQYLDIAFETDPNEGDDWWDAIGSMLSNHASSLRTLHLHNPYGVVMPPEDGAPINLAAMTQLRTLTLPGDAILPSPYNKYGISASLGEQRIDGSHLETVSSHLNDVSRDDGSQHPCMHGPEKGFDHASVSLTDFLPPYLTQLAIVDNTTLPSNVAKLDFELRKIMISPNFKDLETIRIWRDQAPTKHIMEVDWEIQREDRCWAVSRSV